MRKATVALSLLLLVAFAVPACAQGPFADVPTDHWAYPAVNELQQQGILLGYPDGTFQGRRALTRYEFAVAIARMIPVITELVAERLGVTPAPGVTPAQLAALERRIAELEARPAPPIPDLTQFQRLLDQFRDELAALGVDVDALRRDVANLTERVAVLEREVARVRIEGSGDIFGLGTSITTNSAVDRDNRPFQTGAHPSTGDAVDDFENTTALVFDGDLNIRGQLSPMASVAATINYGNYLSYIRFVDDYVNSIRPSSKLNGLVSELFPYYAYIDAGFGAGDFQIGRLPLQFTPYTLRMIDVDTYTSNVKTDSGNYPVDAGKLTFRVGGVALTGFAAKHNQNEVLRRGLTSQATGGLYATVGATDNPGKTPFNLTAGGAAGGLETIDQSAGVRAQLGTPFRGNLGLTYMRVAGQPTARVYEPVAGTSNLYDQADIFGADLNFSWRRFNIGFDYAQTNTLGTSGLGLPAPPDISSLNKAFDGRVGFGLGRLGLDVGYRSVERNFTAPGFWEKIGRWANPSNIQGPYINANLGLTGNLRLVATGAFYQGVNDIGYLTPFAAAIDREDDELWRTSAGLKWGLSPIWTVDAGVEFIRWRPDGAPNTDEAYYTIGAAWQINPSAGLKLAYQIVDYSPDTGAGTAAPYGGASYKGNVAVAEFGVKF